MRQGAPKGASWGSGHSAVTTQFDADQRLNIAAALKEMARLIQGSVHGCNILERVSETCSLRANEKRKAATAAQEAAGKLPVLSGVVEFTTAEAVLYAKDAQKIGIDGLMVLPGMVYTSDTRETLNHFRTVARASDLPIMIYNNPLVYRVDIKPETFGELAAEKTIVAIKESSDDPRRITDLHNLYGDRFILFCGVDDLVLESAALGIEGWVSGLTDVFPEESVELWNLCQAGRFAEARALYRWFTPVLHLDTSPKLVQYIKLGQQVVGIGSEKVRAPRMELAGEERAHILGLYEKAIASRPKLANRPKTAVA